MKVLFFLLLSSSLMTSSSFVKKGISVVQYNAEFNKNNNVNLSKISDAKIFDVYIDNDEELMKFGKIRSVPTIVIYQDRQEVIRWEADLSMKLRIDHEDIQEEIDKLTGINKF